MFVSVAALNAGQLRFVPDANENGTPYGSFTFSVQDSAGAFDAAPNTFAFNVNPVNDNPVGQPRRGQHHRRRTPRRETPPTASSSAAPSLPGRDSDVDGDSLTVTGVSFGPHRPVPLGASLNGANGALTLNANGSYSYTPATATQALDVGESVQDVFTYTVSDGNGGTATTTLTITVTGTNDAPTAVADVGTTPEDTPVSGNVLANDSDIDVEALTVTGFSVAGIATPFTAGQTATIAGVGTLVIGANGAYTFTPAANYTGPVPVAHLHRLRRHRLVHRHAHPERDPGERPRRPAPTRRSPAMKTRRSRSTPPTSASPDPDAGDSLSAVSIESLPLLGELRLNGVIVTAGQIITRAELDSGQLRYLPAGRWQRHGAGRLQLHRPRPGQPRRPGGQPHQLQHPAGERRTGGQPPMPGSTTEDAPLNVTAANGVILSGGSAAAARHRHRR